MNSRMVIVIGVAVVFLACIVGYWNFRKGSIGGDPKRNPADDRAEVIYLDNGFDTKDRQVFYHLTEGSEIYPVLWMRALKTMDDKYFLDDVERIGFLSDPDNPDGLPIGLTSGLARGLEPFGPMSGLNCAACHVGEFHYKGKRVRIDGAPNLLNTREFFVTLIGSALDTAKDPAKLIAFVAKVRELEEAKNKEEPSRIRLLGRKLIVGLVKEEEQVLNAALKPILDSLIAKEFESEAFDIRAAIKADIKDITELNEKIAKDLPADKIAGDLVNHSTVLKDVTDFAEKHGSLKDVLGDLYIKLRLLRGRAEFLKKLGMVGADKRTEIWGPGRVDAFGSARAFLFEDGYPPLTPVSYPPIFEVKSHTWFHYDNNTTTFLERNFGQALGVGAVWDKDSKTYSLQPRNLRTLESLAHKLTAPKWPSKVFGEIDQQRANRGGKLYATYCAKCHDADKNVNFDKLDDLAGIRTDPNRATMFAEKVPPKNTPFPDMIRETLAEIKSVALAEFSPEEQEEIKKEPVAWRAPGTYSARSIKGSWSTAPYLHNGSVPTMYDLLLPAKDRPKTFYVGSREFDVEKLGYVSDATKTLVDTTKAGNSNAGHEGREFGTELSADERRDLLEYLKTQ